MFVSRRVLTVLLAALLASGTLSAPALRHTHAMSEHADERLPAIGHSHDHSHAHHNHGVAHWHDSEDVPTLGDVPVDHVHVVWFGFGLILPVSPNESSPSPDSVGEWVPLLGAMIPSQVVVASDVLGHDSFYFSAVPFAVVTPPSAEPFVPPKISRLCDTARRVRSGVLNI